MKFKFPILEDPAKEMFIKKLLATLISAFCGIFVKVFFSNGRFAAVS